ncbi:hypothetical protein V8B55DRAFT_1389517 [Mucor lusitanicus]|uniref:Uncharacterized protein n=2 Tax=Mucor circinelloides f. lusitanicus TaxID=29924 RepID=A0A168J084_MUCCL|nr:hypothetical protein FB192DRAFT_1329253 [Mucor lusitanicus]OAD00583.1 hypothetical protein MUCCIDRAFT_166356 [Mucor lusitanicus CBS 277.49]
MRSIISTLVFIVLFSSVKADVPSPSHNYNVTLPEPNAPYVAGQMLPISYTLPDDTNLPNLLSLSVLFTTQDPSLNFTDIVITSNADISQGFSFRRTHNTMVYFEHQLSYAIPNNTLPGNYIVLFVDSISKSNTSVPILVRPYAAPVTTLPTNPNRAHPSNGGSIFAYHSNDVQATYQSNWTLASISLGLLLIACSAL